MRDWGLPIAVLLGAVLIAGAILFLGRWEISGDQTTAVRLDRWTGQMTGCIVDPNYGDDDDGGARLICVPHKKAQGGGV